MTHADEDHHNDGLSRLRPSPQGRMEDSSPSRKPVDISALRWRAASAVYKLKGVSLGSGQETTRSIDNCTPSIQPVSSSASIPPFVFTPSLDPFRHIRHLIPMSATGLISSQSRVIQDNWTPLKAALLADGHRVALLHAIIAILINHIRHMFVPWLGTFMFYHPMEDLRLALSNPDVFLDQTLSYSWSWALFLFLQRRLVDAIASWTAGILLRNNGGIPQSTLDKFRASPKAVIISLEGLMHLCKIGVGVYVLMTLDYIFCRITHAVSCIIALYKLATGRAAEHAALEQVLEVHKVQSILILWMVYRYLFYAFRPAISGAVMSTVRGRPGLLIILLSVVGGVWATIRWRARLYILLEMSPMFIVLLELVAVVAFLARELVRRL